MMAAFPRIASLPPLIYEPLVRRALEEDLGRAGDLTSDAILPPDLHAEAVIVARKEGRIAGLTASASAFHILDPTVQVEFLSGDGRDAEAGETLAVVRGPARSILTGERTALNLLGRLCGVATTTHNLVALVAEHGTRIVCTRKTTPGLRALEKYAVKAGGGSNHRFGLDDAVLIKDNHVQAVGSVAEAVRRARAKVGDKMHVEVEIERLDDLEPAIRSGADIVMLDNMSPARMRKAVSLARGRCALEASGGVTLKNVRRIAETGVDFISVGWITHSAPALDVALDFVDDGRRRSKRRRVAARKKE